MYVGIMAYVTYFNNPKYFIREFQLSHQTRFQIYYFINFFFRISCNPIEVKLE